MRKNNQYYIRKVHRWLGVFVGIQFLGWTISGLFFSWTNLDEIHGDHYLQDGSEAEVTTSAAALTRLPEDLRLSRLESRKIGGNFYFWINDSILVDGKSGLIQKSGITQQQAEQVALDNLKDGYQISKIELIVEVGPHHEYRGRPLPVYAVHIESPENIVAYISKKDGSFQRVRHRAWRWFDFLWMFHTMDYQGRDDFNNSLLRVFSIFGLVTVLSGFTLFFVTQRKKKISLNK